MGKSKWINIGITDKGKILVFQGKWCEPKSLFNFEIKECDGMYYPILNIEGVDFSDTDEIRKHIEFMIGLFVKVLENAGYVVKKDADAGAVPNEN